MASRPAALPIWQRFCTETRSVTAVEFGLLAPVLFLLLFAVLLTGIVQFWQFTLDDAARNAARLVAIGAASASAGIHDGSDLLASVCAEFGVAAPGCATGLQYAVQGAPNFTGNGGITPASLNGGQLSQTGTFSGVTIGQPFLVQLAYSVPIDVPLLPLGLLTLNGTPFLIAAAALVAEP